MRAIRFSFLLLCMAAFGQAPEEKVTDDDIVEGNRQFIAGDYSDAESKYRISQSKSPSNASSTYNLGNAVYRQGENIEAGYIYLQAVKDALTKEQKHRAYHNLGNVFMRVKDYRSAVDAYMNALRNNPADEETRYNFALAKKMLKDNKSPENPLEKKGGDSKTMAPKDKGKDPKKAGEGDEKTKADAAPNSDGNSERRQKRGRQGLQNGGDIDGAPKPEPGTNEARQHMENLLDAVNNEENSVQEKVRAMKVPVQRRQEKDW